MLNLPGASEALQDAPLFQKQPERQVKVCPGNNMYLANTGAKDVNIPVGSFLCGYGKGKFGRNVDGAFNPDCQHTFTIKPCNDFVCTTKMITLKEAMAEQKAKNPEAKLADHSMFEVPSKEKDAYGVKQEHEVCCIPAFSSDDAGGTGPANHVEHFG